MNNKHQLMKKFKSKNSNHIIKMFKRGQIDSLKCLSLSRNKQIPQKIQSATLHSIRTSQHRYIVQQKQNRNMHQYKQSKQRFSDVHVRKKWDNLQQQTVQSIKKIVKQRMSHSIQILRKMRFAQGRKKYLPHILAYDLEDTGKLRKKEKVHSIYNYNLYTKNNQKQNSNNQFHKDKKIQQIYLKKMSIKKGLARLSTQPCFQKQQQSMLLANKKFNFVLKSRKIIGDSTRKTYRQNALVQMKNNYKMTMKQLGNMSRRRVQFKQQLSGWKSQEDQSSHYFSGIDRI